MTEKQSRNHCLPAKLRTKLDKFHANANKNYFFSSSHALEFRASHLALGAMARLRL